MDRILRPAAALACALGLLGAADYYVDPAGSDAAAGTSAGSAWKTVAKVNAAALAAGDKVHFKRGGSWRESLAPGSSGATGNPITFDAYGTGAKPVFYGSDVVANAGFTAVGGGVWRCNVGAGIDPAYAYILQDHVFVGSGPATCSAPNLDVALAGDPRSDGKLYTVCRRANVVASNGKSHLVFRDLVADETAANPDGAQQGYGMRAEGSSDIRFENCEALRCGRHNFGIINSDQVTLKNCRAAWVAPAVAGDNSLYVSYADQNLAAASSTTVYDGCTADHQDKVGGGQYDFYDGHSQNGKPLHVTFVGISTGGGKLYCNSDAGGTYVVNGGRINGGRIEVWMDGTVIDGTVFTGSAFIDQWKSGTTIQNCVWDDVTPGETACILLRDGAANNVVRFNTIRANGNCLGFYGAAAGLKLIGNILIGTPTSGGNAGDCVAADWNFYGAVPTAVMGEAWAAWQGAGRDAHAKAGDPLFTAPATGDYHLQAASQAIDAAAVAAGDTPAKDAAGTARPQGGVCDAGAYEVVASGPQKPVISGPLDVWTSTQTVLAYQIQANHAPTAYLASPLPAGLSLTGAGMIGGTATTPGTYRIGLTARDAAGDGTATLVLHVTANAFWPYAGAPILPGRIEAECFDNGGAEVAFHDSDVNHDGIAFRNDTAVDVDVAGSGDDAGMALGWTNAGEWLRYTVEVSAAGSYRFAVRAANGTGPGDLRIKVDGADATGPITIAGTGDWHVFQTFASHEVALGKGVHVITLVFEAGGINVNWIEVARSGHRHPTVSAGDGGGGGCGSGDGLVAGAAALAIGLAMGRSGNPLD